MNIIKSEELSKKMGGIRFVVVNENGKILDDAQGYGYKTKQNAIKAWTYKNRDRSKDKERKIKLNKIKEWFKQHPEILDNIEWNMIDYLKNGEEFTYQDFKTLVEGIECEFKPIELWRAYHKVF